MKRVAVLGAGTMGSQIAAHLANAGIRSLLLDLPGLADGAVKGLARLEPPPFYTTDSIRLIEAGSFENGLERISGCDWIIECVVEQAGVKQELLARVEQRRSEGSVVSTNTSGLPVADLARGRSKEFREHFLGTHFFNPPRYMKLLELIPTAETLPGVVEAVCSLADRRLGKGVVVCKDRPGFVANRIGAFTAMRALHLMQEQELTIEEVDALTGSLIGFPRTATFRLADLVGVDVMLLVAENLQRNLDDDPWRESFRPPGFVRDMVERGWTGRKAGQGFYKKEKGEILALDYRSMEYRPREQPAFASLQMLSAEPRLEKRLRGMAAAGDEAGAFLWPFLRDTLAYAAGRIPEIADHYYEVDRAMRWGYNWQQGPFEMWQALGVGPVADRIRREGGTVAEWVGGVLEQPQKEFYAARADRQRFFDPGANRYRSIPEDEEKIRLQLLRAGALASNPGASLLDLGDGVACLEFHSKVNAIGPDLMEMARLALERVEGDFSGLVIGNQGRDFSVGANLMLLLQAVKEGDWDEIDRMVRNFQNVCMSFRHSPKPVVAAPFGRVLGGGAEICLGCDAVVASAETCMGLVEVGVGLVPAGGGTKEMLRRWTREARSGGQADPVAPVRRAFMNIGQARVSGSAEEARSLRFLAPADGIEIHPDRLLWRAKQKVLELVRQGYIQPRQDREVPAVGAGGLAVLKTGIHLMRRSGYISEHDALVGDKLAYILCGGDLNHRVPVTEQYLLDLEREAFLSLCGERKTQERIRHTLETGKPLRN